jgi:hypothetical protein
MLKWIAAFFIFLATPLSVGATEPTINGWDAISVTAEAKVISTKTAILIANSNYTKITPLAAPPNDVEAMSSRLAELGFETVILRDPTSADLIQAIAAANPKDGRGSLLAFYYSGHAGAIDGENSIVLTEYDPKDGTQTDQIVPLRTVLTLLAAADFEKVFVAFDACRNIIGSEAPKPDAAADAVPSIRGFARSESDFRALNRREYAVLFSTSHGEFALDSTVGGMSPFTKAFLLALGRESSFVPAMLLAKRLTEEITEGAQSPDIRIKWNADLAYARASAVVNRATYFLNDRLSPAEMAGANVDLSKLTTIRKDYIDQAILMLRDQDFKECQTGWKSNLFWSSDVLSIGYCYLPRIGYKASGNSRPPFGEFQTGAIYNTGKYRSAVWEFDLDFDGVPERMEASFRNADMALVLTARTSDFEFRGLIGPNIEFVGLHDFNKDGVLDIYLAFSMFKFTNGSELVIVDGKTISKHLKSLLKCRSREAATSAACQRQAKVRSGMGGSLFTHDLDKSYYGADLLQAALYADWNIKYWEVDETGALKITTYNPTWAYERFQPDNYMMDKVVAFNKATGKLDISLSGKTDKKLSVVSPAARISRAN